MKKKRSNGWKRSISVSRHFGCQPIRSFPVASLVGYFVRQAHSCHTHTFGFPCELTRSTRSTRRGAHRTCQYTCIGSIGGIGSIVGSRLSKWKPIEKHLNLFFGTMTTLRAARSCHGSFLFLFLHFTLTRSSSILVVGSINADTFLPVARLPREGENIGLLGLPQVNVPGGKGCTQAIAASKLTTERVTFVGQFGTDEVATLLLQTLQEHVDTTHCGIHEHLLSGRGYVFRTSAGTVSAVISGGANTEGWKIWEQKWKNKNSAIATDNSDTDIYMEALLHNKTCVMLQREIPEDVNLLIATEAQKRNIIVFQDVGGEDRAMSTEMLIACDYIIPNESELCRLVQSFGTHDSVLPTTEENHTTIHDNDTIIKYAKILQQHGARNVLVTRGSRGSTLVTQEGQILTQSAHPVDHVVDETGAGDCYRAAFCVSLLEHKTLSECLAFASAAGACAVTKNGAVTSTPSRDDVDELFRTTTTTVLHIPRGGAEKKPFPFLFGSRLNSMKDRPELWPESLQDPSDFVTRQATIQGLTCVDFNYPQHFLTWSTADAKAALDNAGLVAGAVCLRYPSKFSRGAMNHPYQNLRREAIELTKEAALVARELGCHEVVVWSAYDGYDYPFQVDYDEKWNQLVHAFQECCDAFPDILFSLEYKPTDENTRFFTVPSTGAALLLVNTIDRPNMGLTLDVGHMLMSGENPGQSIAMVGKKLFGIQLNDGYTRLAAEDGLMFGSVHPSMALEIMYQLKRIGYKGHFYFDTFPQRSDPVKECEYNIAKVKRFWEAVEKMNPKQLERVTKEHDAIEALTMVDEALRSL